MRWFYYLLTLVLAILLGVLGYFQYLRWTHPYHQMQVNRLPPPVDVPVIDYRPHLALVTRPDDTYFFPIPLGEVGPSQPLYAGPRQYPFFCMTLLAGLGQPAVDNHQGYGVPVYEERGGRPGSRIVGYSRDCGLPSRLSYYFADIRGQVRRYDPGAPPPPEAVAQTRLGSDLVPEIYRVESGTINRYIYHIAMLATPQQARTEAPWWNRKLIYQFHGGSGIGFRQGRVKPIRLLSKRREQLRSGYAVITSSGNKTSYTYDMIRAEDTARRVKRQFTSLYGQPRYTIGIGGSGGGLAQYLMAQNRAGVFDGALALYAYPDMVTQTLYGLDCDLLNTYYAFRARRNHRWQDFDNRVSLEGMNARAGFDHKAAFLEPLNQLLHGRWPSWPEGSSECINGWFGLSALIHNPHQGYIRPMFSEPIQARGHWSYWEDLVEIYGRDARGYARSAWGNMGVQYGLRPLVSGQLTMGEFLHLNRHIGSWRRPHRMEAESIWLPLGNKLPLWLSLWGNHNITEGAPAERRQPDPIAVERAYRSGQVFVGSNPLPVIDLRHYLEPELDMHHLSASFEARARILAWEGHRDNQVIWVSHRDYTPIAEAFAAMEGWLEAKVRGEPRPAGLEDQCFDEQGKVIYRGEDAWDGEWNHREPGACSQRYPHFSNSRVQAGGPWLGSVFQCRLIPLEQAVARGQYGSLDVGPYLARLKAIFPGGVCDLTSADALRPADLNPALGF
ncbi:hypothetical protein FCL40_03540 [Ferrimonas sediminicola]|uniref:DUF6351 domain-containing protein n=1 Tax=Ferrimonas sediminicola TaxID=2569538 RepID=A0A4U1BHK4_9GAMM|nr:DUF6351 family protein [Ferrimonas sediminicola]TKB50246.1 hypothetical protein FCL40_03540 [Ferrimonas sediminicola]